MMAPKCMQYDVCCSSMLIILNFTATTAKSPSQVALAHPSPSSSVSGSEHSTPATAKKRKIVYEVLSPTPSNSSGVTVLEPLQIDAVDEMLAVSPLMQEESSDGLSE